jgi:hypothetical protein
MYIVHESGLLIYEYEFQKDTEELASSDLISGGIIGLVTMLKEITKSKDNLRTIDHGNKKHDFYGVKMVNNIVFNYKILVISFMKHIVSFANTFENILGKKQ